MPYPFSEVAALTTEGRVWWYVLNFGAEKIVQILGSTMGSLGEKGGELD